MIHKGACFSKMILEIKDNKFIIDIHIFRFIHKNLSQNIHNIYVFL